MSKAQLIRHWQRPAVGGVVRPGEYIVPNRGNIYNQLPDTGFVRVDVTTGQNTAGNSRGFDTLPEEFGEVDPEDIEGVTIDELSISEAGLVVLALDGGGTISDTPKPFGGLNVYLDEELFSQIAMAWNADNLRYESVSLHPDLFAAFHEDVERTTATSPDNSGHDADE